MSDIVLETVDKRYIFVHVLPSVISFCFVEAVARDSGFFENLNRKN